MPTDWRKEARNAALRAGIDPNIYERQIGTESNFDPHAVSPAGALGIAQFMPATAKGMGIDPTNPRQALDGGARLMASYVKKYGNYADALTAYNAGPGRVGKVLPTETRNYIDKILGSSNSSAAGGTSSPAVSSTTQGTFDQAGYQQAMRQAILGRLLSSQGQNQHNNSLFATGVLGTQDPNPTDYTGSQQIPTLGNSVMRSTPTPTPTAAGLFKVAPGANRPGTQLAGVLQNFVADVAGHARKTLDLTTGTNHSKFTVDGRVSDHASGHAGDFAVPVDGHEGDTLAAHALVAAGLSWNTAWSMARKGGLWTITPTKGAYKGKRIQVIWRTNQGGNHHNHVHIGIR